MNSEEMCDSLVFLLIIAGRKRKDVLLSALLEMGAQLTSTVYGKGTVKASYLQDMLGLVPEENKTVISSIMTSECANMILKQLVRQFNFDKPNTGVAFTIPIEELSF